jgi:lysophospholipase L1-like esterase
MRSARLALLLVASVATVSATLAIGACSSAEGSASGDPALDGAAPEAGGDPDGNVGDGGGDTASDGGGGGGDARADGDGASVTDAGDGGAQEAAAPAVQLIGRFDTSDPVGAKAAWPGSRIVARFDGTDVSVTLTQTNGFSGGPTYFNTIVDGVATDVFAVAGTQTIALAAGLPAGVHTVEIEKRTEAPFGTARFEGFTFAGGTGLLAPPARLGRKLEFLGDSTIDGYGVDGDRNVTCTLGSAPPLYNDVRKSVAWKTANGVAAELHLMGYSAKGVARNEDKSTVDTFPVVYTRTLPDVAGAWSFASFVPDVVVVSLGGSDYGGDPNGTFPADFATKYAQLVSDIRARYGAATHVFLTVWSQHKSYNDVRQSVTAAIDTVIAGRPAGEKTYKFVFPEAPVAAETGCQYHANDQHHTDMAALLAQEIKGKTGWP